MMLFRVCKFCGEILESESDESLFNVRNSVTSDVLGDMHFECALENLPPGEYEAKKFRSGKFYFVVKERDE